MPKDFNQSTSLESYLKLQWVYSNTSTIIIRTLYVSNINTDCVQLFSWLFDSLFHTPPQANYNNCNSVCSPCSIIHLLRQVKLTGKSGELYWEIINWKQLCYWLLEQTLSVLDRLHCVHDRQRSTAWKKIVFPFRRGSIPVSTVLRKSVRFFIINIFLVKNFKLSKLISGKWFGQSVNIPSEWLRNPGKGTLLPGEHAPRPL